MPGGVPVKKLAIRAAEDLGELPEKHRHISRHQRQQTDADIACGRIIDEQASTQLTPKFIGNFPIISFL